MSTTIEPNPISWHIPRERRDATRVPMRANESIESSSLCRLTDISATRVGFLAPRSDAALLDDALVLVNLDGTGLVRATVQRVDLGGSSEEWVQVGARFAELEKEERASLRAFVAGHDA